MLELPLNPFPELSTTRLLLRQLQPDDVNEIFLLRSDENINELIDRQKATSIEECEAFISKIIAIQNSGEGITWVITLKDDTELIGTILYWNIVKEDDKAEIGYEMLPQYHGKGFMQEAVLKVIDFGFNTLKLKKIVADTKAVNHRSVNLLEKCGFTKTDIDGNYLMYQLKIPD